MICHCLYLPLHPVVGQLARCTTRSNEQAKLWRQQGSYSWTLASMPRPVAFSVLGAEKCPENAGLQHHLRVFRAFHGYTHTEHADDDSTAIAISAETVTLPPLPQVPDHSYVFLSLNVPPDAIQKSIQNCHGPLASTDRARLLHASKDPIFSKDTCSFIIQSVKKKQSKDSTTDGPRIDTYTHPRVMSQSLTWTHQHKRGVDKPCTPCFLYCLPHWLPSSIFVPQTFVYRAALLSDTMRQMHTAPALPRSDRTKMNRSFLSPLLSTTWTSMETGGVVCAMHR
jgi:hypothetical protein